MMAPAEYRNDLIPESALLDLMSRDATRLTVDIDKFIQDSRSGETMFVEHSFPATRSREEFKSEYVLAVLALKHKAKEAGAIKCLRVFAKREGDFSDPLAAGRFVLTAEVELP